VVNPSRATYDVQLVAPADRSGALRHGVSLVGGQRQCKPAVLIIARLLWVCEWWHAYVGARGCRGPGLGLVQASTASRADPCEWSMPRVLQGSAMRIGPPLRVGRRAGVLWEGNRSRCRRGSDWGLGGSQVPDLA